ncbi:MAG TPA: sigma 54-interacting transcriptional regulator [Blastocatellia bacterium]|nr:sigma 54-interacting transcriptional regulator [Blastocatellia bacterium]
MQVFERNLFDEKARTVLRAEDEPYRSIRERLIGESRWAESARKAILAHAAHNNPVVIEGEPGSGKELIARLIHENSARREGPFVSIAFDCVSEESIETVLFGPGRKYMPSCASTQGGLIKSADGGTLYLSGALSISASLRARIAHFIERGELNCDEGDRVEFSDVRILFGTRLPIQPDEVASLGVSDTIRVLPLRQRREDIEPLARSFVTRFCEETGREIREISPEAMISLCNYDWPGNVAELRGVIWESILKSGPPRIEQWLLPVHITSLSGFNGETIPERGINLAEELERIEVKLLRAALKQSHGVQYKAAQLLGLKPTTLNMKLSRYGIDVKAHQ